MRVCIIDIGSNTVKMSVFDHAAGNKRNNEVYRSSISVGLYSYLSSGVLSEEGIDVLVRAILQFQQKAAELACNRVYAFATAAVRMSRNSGEIVADVLKKTGLTIDVLDGQTEAAITYLSAEQTMPDMPPRGICVDLGGASTEITRFQNGVCRESVSVRMGALSIYTQEINNLLPNKAEWTRINKYVDGMLEQHDFVEKSGEVLLIGGSARICAKIFSKSENVSLPFRFSVKEMQQFITRLLDGDKRAQLDLLRASPERVHLMMPAMCIFLKLAKLAGARYLTATSANAREGYMLRLCEAGA